MEVNGIAHIQVSVNRFEECIAFYDHVMPYLGLQAVHRSEEFVYYVGGRTGYNVSRADPQYAGERHVATRSGLHHVCFRARSRGDIDELYGFMQGIGATMVRAPEEGPWAPGYYSLSFRTRMGSGSRSTMFPARASLLRARRLTLRQAIP